MTERSIHQDFLNVLKYKDQELIDLYIDLRAYILSMYPESNELLYHTHALTSVYSISEKLGDASIMIPIYTNHLNLGFNKGTLLEDPHGLLQGTGKLIRHIPITKPSDYRNKNATQLITEAIDFALNDTNSKTYKSGLTISKIKS
ncbi:MAG: hypothetical protein DA407_05805 [Bacteroidetes bacterium]|nr:MAG: hypothetical protein DA407_05805 [Bacteroidota bacterium]